MKVRLSKISRELNAQVSDLSEFLRLNGYDCDEDPSEEIPIEQAEIIKFNFPAYLAEKINQENKFKKPQDKTNVKSSPEQIPLELKIIEAAGKEKRLVERIIGFTDFDWRYVTGTYTGVCSQPVDFNLFDEVICDLLLVEQMSASDIGNILGLDINRDPAEKQILLSAITELKKDKMIDGDESILWLTELGKEYAKEGVKFSTFTRDFDLYFDEFNSSIGNTKEIFSKIKSEKVEKANQQIPNELEAIKSIAELQAPEIHFPKKGFHLQGVDFIKTESFKAKVWVVLLENFRDNKLRALVYDEKQNKIIDELSEVLDRKDDIKTSLLAKLITKEEDVEFTEESKSSEQIEIENQLIQKQSEIDAAIESNQFEKVIELGNEATIIKRHFNSLEFEIELKKLFDETADDLWIISPWIKNATFKRVNFFEKYLKKGGKIFVAYSEPEQEDQVMAYEEPLKKLEELEKNYTNFFLHQLPPFHYKNVWLKTSNNQDYYYTGSYNILSFFVSQGIQKVRQEKMTKLDWNNEVQNEFDDVIKLFGLKYINKAIDDFNGLCQSAPKVMDKQFLNKIKAVDYIKLKPFLKTDIKEFNDAYAKLEQTKLENLNIFRKRFFDQELGKFTKLVAEIGDKPITQDRRRNLLLDLERLRDENMDFLELQIVASKIKDSISNLRIMNLSNNNKKNKRR